MEFGLEIKKTFYNTTRVQCDRMYYSGLMRNRVISTPFSEFEKCVEYFEIIKTICGKEIERKQLFLTPYGLERVRDMNSFLKHDRPILDVAKILAMIPTLPSDCTVVGKTATQKKQPEVEDMSIEELAYYFQEVDIFKYFKVTKKLDYIQPTLVPDRYYQYLKEYLTKDEIVDMMRLYYAKNAMKNETGTYDYNSQELDFYYKSMEQMEMYDTLLQPGNKYVIHSDGLGIMSMLAIKKNIEYISSEPNPIGALARTMGIIQNTFIKDDYEDYIHIYSYCCKYYVIPMTRYQKYVVIDTDVVELPGIKLSTDTSISPSLVGTAYETAISGYFKKHTYKDFIIKSAYPLDTSMAQLMINMNVPRMSLLQCQFVLASNVGVVNTNLKTVLSRRYWEDELAKNPQDGYTPKKALHEVRQKTMIFFSKSFPFRGVGAKYHRNLEIVSENRPDNVVVGDDYFDRVVPMPSIEVYHREGAYFLVPASRHLHVHKYIQLNEEDQAYFKTYRLHVLLVTIMIIRDRKYQVYIRDDQTQFTSHPFVLR